MRRSTLVLLRWMAIAGQTLAILGVYFGLGFDLPLIYCFLLISMSALVNLVVTFALPLDRRVSDQEAILQLGFDLVQLAGLLWLTGGMHNPFSLLLIAPVVTSASTLSRSVLFFISITAISLSIYLVYDSWPLPWSGEAFELPLTFRVGLWAAVMVGMVFTSMYAWRSASESRRMSDALRATESILAHEQKLSALGGLAAAAAHELGTPLATIRLTAKEMSREVEPDTPEADDINLLLSQTERCRKILGQLSQWGDKGDPYHDNMPFDVLLDEVSEPYELINPKVIIDIEYEGPDDPPIVQRRPELIYGLRNMIENAVSYANSRVLLTGVWNEDEIQLTVADDGPGFDAAIRDRLGEPYVSGRNEKRKAGGLGLGLFIAKTLLERTNARVRFDNQRQGGAIVTIRWPKGAILGMGT